MLSKTIAPHEIEKFRRLKDFWWSPNGALRSLHLFNPVRVQFIRETVQKFGKQKSGAEIGFMPDHRILDVGCGGGILSESLARLGATVTGIDACAESVGAATCRLHALRAVESEESSLLNRIEFREATLLDIVTEKKQFDVVVASEVIEHVDSARCFLEGLCAATAPGGVLILSTMDKSLRTALTHIALAEHLTGIVPVGTHDWAKFIPPPDMKRFAKRCGVHEVDLRWILTLPDVHQTVVSRKLQLQFALTRKVNTGHYFWAGVKLP